MCSEQQWVQWTAVSTVNCIWKTNSDKRKVKEEEKDKIHSEITQEFVFVCMYIRRKNKMNNIWEENRKRTERIQKEYKKRTERVKENIFKAERRSRGRKTQENAHCEIDQVMCDSTFCKSLRENVLDVCVGVGSVGSEHSFI